MQLGHVFTLANRSMKKPLLMATSVALSVGVLLGSAPAFADPATDILGTYRDTSEPDQWIVKYLGTLHEWGSLSEWDSQRSYTDGVLDTSVGYSQAQVVTPGNYFYLWATEAPWISRQQDNPTEPQGYYSFVTIVNDTGITGIDPTTSFSGLSISFSADNWLAAFFINGVIYDGFTPSQNTYSYRSYEDLFIPSGGNIPWNVGGDNIVEIIIYNDPGGANNPTGLSATIQAHYAPIPEPEAWAMLLAGLGIVGAVTRRQA